MDLDVIGESVREERAKKSEKKREKKGADRVSRFDRWLNNSIFARFLIFFGAFEEKLPESAAAQRASGFFRRRPIREKILGQARRVFAREISQSMILGVINSFFELLLRLPMRAYGAFLLVFAFGSSAAVSLRAYRAGEGLFSLKTAIYGSIFILLALILMTVPKNRSAGRSIFESRCVSYILFDLLGVRKNAFEHAAVREANYAVVLLVSILLSAASFWLDPFSIVFAILWVFYVRMSLCSPESGLIAVVLFLPFVPQTATVWMTAFVLVGYCVKLLRGKRVSKPSFFGIFMLLFAILAAVGVLVTRASGGTIRLSVYLTALFVFFLSQLMMDRRESVMRAASAFSLSAIVSAVWIIVTFIISYLPAISRAIVPAIAFRKLPPGLATAESAGIMIGIASVILFARFFDAEKMRFKILTVAALLILCAGAIVSRSPAAWIALIAALLVLLIFHKNAALIPTVAVCGVFTVVYVAVLPTFITDYVKYFSTGFTASASEIAGELGECARHFFAGVGEAGASGEGNFYSHILVSNGLIGLLFLLFAVFGILAFAYYALHSNDKAKRGERRIVYGYCAAFCAMLIAGFFCDLFNDPKLLCVFFAAAGLIVSCGRVLLREKDTMTVVSDLEVILPFAPALEKKGRKDAPEEERRSVLYIFDGKDEPESAPRAERPDEASEDAPPDEGGQSRGDGGGDDGEDGGGDGGEDVPEELADALSRYRGSGWEAGTPDPEEGEDAP